jgi:hypothetical protein
MFLIVVPLSEAFVVEKPKRKIGAETSGIELA